jgi:CRISPR-associated endonuclease Csn1
MRLLQFRDVFHMRVLGLDGGIASIGWALIEIDNEIVAGAAKGQIIGAGTWMFDPPEDKGQSGTKLRSAERRLFRGQRHVIRRRRQRMNMLRGLFVQYGLLPTSNRDSLKIPGFDPWRLRVAALERELTAAELAVALGHIARHRGFKSNAKGAAANADDRGKVLKASAETQEKLTKYGTSARMLIEDDSFVVRETIRRDGSSERVRRFRNREGDYSRSLLRDDLESEVRAIFRAQRRLRSGFATAELEREFLETAFFQRPLQDSEAMIGRCPFEPSQKRAAKRSPSFELFRYLSRLNTLTLVNGRETRRLTPEELGKAVSDFGATAKISFYGLRQKLGLAPAITFDGVKADEERKRDVVARSGEAAAGTARLRKLIAGHHGEMAWHALADRPAILDAAAQVISFRDDLDSIAKGLDEIAIEPAVRATLLKAASDGELDLFTGAGHISTKAARAIIPGLLQGLTYDKACALVGFDHTTSRERQAFDVGVTGKEALARILKEERISRELIGSPTARKALIEMVKQVKAVIEDYGLPDGIHIELARDVGKSIEERDEIERGIEKRNKQKDRMRLLFADKVGRPPQDGPRGAEELLRFELWEQQNGRCLYSDDYISPEQIVAGDGSVQVDHILPWSRFGDDSFHNKTLCTAKANQEKKGQTPFEWFKSSKSEAEWDAFVARVRAIPFMKGMKRRNYLLKDAREVEERFRARNLNDTRWACRLLAEALRQALPDAKDENGKLRRRVFARPGALTNLFRRAWGLQWIKKDKAGKRIPDDRHHALDAIIVAATTESMLNRATREVQEIETKGLCYDLRKNIGQPWPGFLEQVLAAIETVFVARAERRRARGKAHDATIRQIGERDGAELVFERKKVGDLKLPDLDRIKDKDRNAALVANLKAWIEAGKPAGAPPLSPKGDPISKVRLETAKAKRIDLVVREGQVDRGEMARVDVFSKEGPKGAPLYRFVPIYPDQIAKLAYPPDRAVTRGKQTSDWELMDETWRFFAALNPFCFIQLIDEDGVFRAGYFRRLNINDACLILSASHDSTAESGKIGTRRLLGFKKFAVDRLGRAFEVGPETRTWHGEACT